VLSFPFPRRSVPKLCVNHAYTQMVYEGLTKRQKAALAIRISVAKGSSLAPAAKVGGVSELVWLRWRDQVDRHRRVPKDATVADVALLCWAPRAIARNIVFPPVT